MSDVPPWDDSRWPTLRDWDNDPTSPNYETEAQFRARVDAYIIEITRLCEERGYRLDPETGLYKHTILKRLK